MVTDNLVIKKENVSIMNENNRIQIDKRLNLS